MVMLDLLESRLEEVEKRIAAAARRSGRDPKAITLVMVSKKQPIESMLAIQGCCQRRALRAVFGESYVQEFKKKKEFLPPGYEAHLIGPLQSNKVREAVRLFDVIESVHSSEVAALISKEAARIGKTQKILLQVNISDDPAKHGFSPKELGTFVREQLPELPNIDCLGLMTITRLYERPEDGRPDFRALKRLGLELQALEPLSTMLRGKSLELSMGMSHDFEVAIEEGATWVRVGTALFGERR